MSIAREFYLGAVVDRTAEKPVLIASSEGGMEIEHVAATMPERIYTEPFDPDAGLRPHQVRKVAWRLGLPRTAFRAAEEFMAALGRMFLQYDCSLLEINPLVLTADHAAAGLGRQDELRRQRLVPASRVGRPPRPGRRGAGRGPGRRSRAQLCQARRQYRLPGQRGRVWP